jgi:CelD/BcsL family acetyltransferase involved in cellulose biosynthesis
MNVDRATPSLRRVDVSVATDPMWSELVESRTSDVFHSPLWASVLADTYGFDVRGRVLQEGDRPVAGMAIVTVDDHLGRRHVSLPFSDFCDPLVDDPGQLAALMGDILAGEDAIAIRSRLGDAAGHLLPEAGTLAWHGIAIDGPPEEIWTRIDPSARRAIRKATGAGVVVREADSLSDVRMFFELHLGVRKGKYHLLSQPWQFFEAIWRHFLEPGNGVLLLAEIDGRTVSGVLFLVWSDTLYYKFNASDLDTLELRPNDLVLWNGIEWAHRNGLLTVDLGVSDLDQPGLLRYKEKYARLRGQVTVHKRAAAEVTAASDQARSVLHELTALFVDPSVPDSVTERAGDLLYRFFA